MPTALELSQKERQKYIDAALLRQPSQELTPEDRHACDAVISQIAKVSAELKKRFGVRRVILFGSLAHRAWFTADADVDLAVEGLRGQDYWDAWRLAEEIILDRPVELIDIETASKPLQRAIQRTGIEF